MMRITRNSKKTLIDRVMERLLVAVMTIALVMGGIITTYLFGVKNKMKNWNYSIRLELSSGNSTMSCTNANCEMHMERFLEWANKHTGFEHKEADDVKIIECYTKEKNPQGLYDEIRVSMLEDGSYIIEDWSVPKWLKHIVNGPLRVRVPSGWYNEKWENYI